MKTRYRYFDDVRDTLERAGLKKRNITTSPVLCMAIGCAAGLVLGVGMTMLMAPMSGREARARLSGKARQFATAGRRSAQELSQRAQRAAGEIREGFEQAQSQVQQPSEVYGQEIIR